MQLAQRRGSRSSVGASSSLADYLARQRFLCYDAVCLIFSSVAICTISTAERTLSELWLWPLSFIVLSMSQLYDIMHSHTDICWPSSASVLAKSRRQNQYKRCQAMLRKTTSGVFMGPSASTDVSDGCVAMTASYWS
jgi:hypothetical protein